MADSTIIIGTRGSALALAQSNMIAAQCRAALPQFRFELKIIKTTGDKLQTASMAQGELPKGLFTKELEVALLDGRADFAVHSLKDLPTELPPGLKLGAVGVREDVRDVMIYRAQGASMQPARRAFGAHMQVRDLPAGATVATSSTRRRAQLLAIRPDLKAVEIRGNVATRMQKLAAQPELDATILALAGLKRLGYRLTPDGRIEGKDVPTGLLATILDVDSMLPCVGQAAIGIEVRTNDGRIDAVCAQLNHFETFQCVTAERAFLAGMGGGCLAPVAAYAEPVGGQISMRAVSFVNGCRRAEAKGAIHEPAQLGAGIAAKLK
ncbi:MAG TPA: hydroxymethylbilane synthase [Verrucomicrobiae bacterium]|nr:hydroxymethylbilane synthase [Verrucomicrobiae bacterium]